MAAKTSFGIRQVTPLPLLATKVMPYLADVYHGHQPRRAYSAAASSALKVEIGYVGGYLFPQPFRLTQPQAVTAVLSLGPPPDDLGRRLKSVTGHRFGSA